MTQVTHKERRFSQELVEEYSLSEEHFIEPQPVRKVEGILACPESRRPAKKKNARMQTPNFVHFDEMAFFADSGNPVPQIPDQHTPSGRTAKPFNPPMHELPREAKRATSTQIRGLNKNMIHIDEKGYLHDGPKKVSGFDQLRELLGTG